MSHPTGFYIDGQWVAPSQDKTIDVINPATEEPIATVGLGTPADVDRAVAAAKRAFASFPVTTREERVALLDRVIEEYKARYDDIAETITKEIGAPSWFAREVQAGMALRHFIQTRDVLRDYPFEYMMGGTLIRREAFGVCGLITAWNWPLNLIASKLAPALAAGCTVVLKPSELSPLSANILGEVLEAAGVPPGVFNMVVGDGPTVGHAISSHPDIDLISFTGSTRAGVQIAKDAADTVKRVHQELGGKSANIILPDADLTVAVPDGVRRAFINSGQSCIAPTRMLIQRDQIDEAVRLAKETAEAMVVGEPTATATRLGPIANGAQFARVQTMIEIGISEGANLVCGGVGRPDGLNRGYYVRPTIFSDVTPDMRIAKEEIFGPVLSIMTYEDEDDAVEIANNTVYGLAGYVFSSDRSRAQEISKKLRAGRVFINGSPTDVVAPFGGYKQSGNGREAGVFGLEEFLEIKAVLGYEPQ